MNRAVLYAPLAALCAFATNAQAQYTTVDLSSYVNQGFADSWFIDGSEFAPIIGNTFGNQGSAVPFDVANVQSSPTSGIDNNFWYGLFGGSKQTITIPVTTPGVRTVYTLADNTFGKDHDNIEFTVEFQGTVGTVIEYYWGAINTKDYTHDCTTTGCGATPTAKYWFVDASGSQWLQISKF